MKFKRFISCLLDGLMFAAVTTLDEPRVMVRRGEDGDLRPVRKVKMRDGSIVIEW